MLEKMKLSSSSNDNLTIESARTIDRGEKITNRAGLILPFFILFRWAHANESNHMYAKW